MFYSSFIPHIHPFSIMGLAKLKPVNDYDFEQYLEIDRESDERFEFLDGEVYEMAGESEEHGDICTNLVREISTQLKGTPCRARSKDTKVRSGAVERLRLHNRGMFSYPDVVVICGKTEFHDQAKDVVVNPAVVIEVLSDSTGEFDRGEKFMRYRNFNRTLSDYILVSQSTVSIEHYARQADNSWLLREYHDLEAAFSIHSINCVLQLGEIYDRVEFVEV